jgi:carbohydrate kinase (thermoresistant glucokinase family)
VTPQTAPCPIVVVAGVSGSGKTTLGKQLSLRLGWSFKDGDELHPAANIRKMQAGVPLTDEDRAPWLGAVGGWVDGWRTAREPGVITCSALKRAYRDRLAEGRPEVRFVFIRADRARTEARLAARRGHFMPASLLASQFADLEPPQADATTLIVDADDPTALQVDRVVRGLATKVAGSKGPLLKRARPWR